MCAPASRLGGHAAAPTGAWRSLPAVLLVPACGRVSSGCVARPSLSAPRAVVQPRTAQHRPIPSVLSSRTSSPLCVRPASLAGLLSLLVSASPVLPWHVLLLSGSPRRMSASALTLRCIRACTRSVRRLRHRRELPRGIVRQAHSARLRTLGGTHVSMGGAHFRSVDSGSTRLRRSLWALHAATDRSIDPPLQPLRQGVDRQTRSSG